MKKILFIGLSAFLCFGAQAQQKNESIMFEKSTNRLTHYETNDAKLTFAPGKSKALAKAAKSNKKTRLGGSRWYSHLLAVDTLLGGNGAVVNNNGGLLIWQDSTVKQVFNTGAGTINYSSYYNVLDPVAPVFNNANYSGEIGVGLSNVYSVDSVVIWGAYFRPKGGNPDTLIISVVKNSANQAINDVLFYNLGKTAFPEMVTNNYVTGTGADTSMSLPTIEADSIKAIGVNTNQTFVIKKVLTNADTSSFITPYVFALPAGGLTADAGGPVGLTVTYKSGNPWVANVDTVTKQNHFLGLFSEEQTGLAQEYRGNAPDLDLNMSGLMFSWVRSDYYPSFIIEMWNTVAFNREIAWIDYHVNCATCGPVGVNDIEDNSIVTTVTPNPASDNVKFSINLENSANNVTVSLANILGQEVKSINVGAVSANNGQTVNMNIGGLASGLYIYTINADGNKVSNKLQVK